MQRWAGAVAVGALVLVGCRASPPAPATYASIQDLETAAAQAGVTCPDGWHESKPKKVICSVDGPRDFIVLEMLDGELASTDLTSLCEALQRGRYPASYIKGGNWMITLHGDIPDVEAVADGVQSSMGGERCQVMYATGPGSDPPSGD